MCRWSKLVVMMSKVLSKIGVQGEKELLERKRAKNKSSKID